MKNMTFRLTMWATVGFIVSLRWGLYFASADKSLPIGSNVSTLAYVTQPIATAIAYYLRTTRGVSLSAVALINAATYALLGFIIETLRRPTPAPRLSQN